MTRNRKRSRSRTPLPAARAGRFSRRAQVWLATLGTVVGVATGMVALAKEVTPKPGGTAHASAAGFQQSVGPVCEDVVRHDADRVSGAAVLGHRLRRAHTPLKARDALLESYQRTLRNTENDEARFAALSAPQPSAAEQRDVVRAWTRNIERLRGIVARLDDAGTWAKLDAVADHIGRMRTPIDRDVSQIRTGLLGLGAGQCHLEAQGVSPPVVLPPHARAKDRHSAAKPRRRPVDPPPAQAPAPPQGTTPVERSPESTTPTDPVDTPPTQTQAPAPVDPSPPARGATTAPTSTPVEPPGPGGTGAGG